MLALQPALLIGVPRVWERVMNSALKKVHAKGRIARHVCVGGATLKGRTACLHGVPC